MWRLIFSCRLIVLSVALGASSLTQCPMALSRTCCKSTTWPTICEYKRRYASENPVEFNQSDFDLKISEVSPILCLFSQQSVGRMSKAEINRKHVMLLENTVMRGEMEYLFPFLLNKLQLFCFVCHLGSF